jgi:hypothetical protein
MKGGDQWGNCEKRPFFLRAFKKEWIPFLAGNISGKPLLVKCIDAPI